MFRARTSDAEPAAAYGGVTYESLVVSFTGLDNDATVQKRLGELGAQGWEPVAVVGHALAHGKRVGEGFAVILKRRVVDPGAEDYNVGE